MTIELIFNRTLEDINNAREIIQSKIKKFSSLTDSEKEILQKGTLTLDTINRIESKFLELKDGLNKIGYYDTNIVYRTWAKDDYFTEDDFAELIENVNILRKSFFTDSTTPKTPSTLFSFEEVNDFEKILYDIGLIADGISTYYKKCGTFACGGE